MQNIQRTTPESDQSLTPSRFYLLYAVIVIAGLLLRWIGLDQRPMHHDESLHAMFGRYFFDWPDHNYYKYDPMMHGPFIYNVLRLVYNSLGSTTWAARSLTAFFGSLLIFAPYFFRRYLSREMILTLTAAISLSPTIIYWARFIREDTLQLSSMLLLLCGALLFKGGLKIYGVLLGLTLQFCIKENSFVTVAILIGYLSFEAGMARLTILKERPLRDDLNSMYSGRSALLFIGLFIGALILALAKFNPTSLPRCGLGTPGDITLASMFTSLESSLPGEWLIFGLALITYAVIGLLLKAEIVRRPELNRYQWCLLGGVAASIICMWAANWWLTALFFVQLILILEVLFQICQQWSSEGLFVRSMQYLRDYWGSTLAAFALCAFIYCYLYSAGFRHEPGILDGLFRKSIVYWWGQHAIERIAGPFLFHFYVLSWYDFLFVVAFAYHLYLFYKKADRPFQIAGALVALGALFCVARYWSLPIEKQPPWKAFNVKDILDMIGFFIFIGHALIVTTYHLLRREQALAFWGYFFTANLFTYSYLGEKVPWLTVYAFMPGIIYFVLYFNDHFSNSKYSFSPLITWDKVFIFIGFWLSVLGLLFMLEDKNLGGGADNNWMFLLVGALFFLLGYAELYTKAFGRVNLKFLLLIFFIAFNVRQAILTNFVYAGHANEYLSQVHTTPEFHNFVLKMKEQIKIPMRAKQTTVFGEGDVTWPITWYLVDTPEYKFIAEESERLKFDYIFRDFKENDTPPPAGFRSWKLPLRGWWVPDFKGMTLKRFLHYMLSHRPWSDSGFTYVTVWVKTDNQ